MVTVWGKSFTCEQFEIAHRPELLLHWINKLSTSSNDTEMDWPSLIVIVAAAILATLSIVIGWEIGHDSRHRP
jgi:hypothetical protein